MRGCRLWLLTVLVVSIIAGGCDGDVGSGGADSGSEPGLDAIGLPDAGEGADVAPPGEDVPLGAPDERTPGEPDVPVVPDVPALPPAPTVALALAPYTAVSGTFTFPATWTGEVTALTLLLDGVEAGALDPADPTLDTTDVVPGRHQVAVRVADDAGQQAESAAVPAIFAGNGAFLPITDAWDASEELPGWDTFEITVPASGDVYDEKGHVSMPSGRHKAMAWLYWTCDTSWHLGFDIGTGNCPHSGQLLAEAEADAALGPLELSYEAPTGTLRTGTWFAHVRFLGAADHVGETLCLNAIFLALP
jgi:hypothetical protein